MSDSITLEFDLTRADVVAATRATAPFTQAVQLWQLATLAVAMPVAYLLYKVQRELGALAVGGFGLLASRQLPERLAVRAAIREFEAQGIGGTRRRLVLRDTGALLAAGSQRWEVSWGKLFVLGDEDFIYLRHGGSHYPVPRRALSGDQERELVELLKRGTGRALHAVPRVSTILRLPAAG
jgi:hypothetical protein